MSRRSIANVCAIPAAIFLVVIGVLHGVVNAAGFRRAIGRGEIAERLGDSVIVLGIAGVVWKPESPSVLIFLFFGALLAVPLLVGRREFTSA